ncbi:MAG TPA: tail fiber protein [Anaerolineae bacterium]|nr:tail fiber protein [Anaerolineae bacterium]HNU02840.1 tail fiber protein [Anaerolineae bacterium]
MTEPFIGEIQIFPFGITPRGWAQCNGQLLPINQNQALFSLLGTMYGGNGQTTFALPDLRGRAALGVGAGYDQGQRAGEEMHSLYITEMPMHSHGANASSAPPSTPSPAGAAWTNTGAANYAAVPNAQMAGNAVAPAGSGQPHENRSPYLALNFCIALVGIYPSRD